MNHSEDSRLLVPVDARSVARRLVASGTLYFVVRLKGIITLPIFARLLGPSGLGQFSLIGVTVNMLWPTATLGLHSGAAAHLAHERDPQRFAVQYYSGLNAVFVAVIILPALVAVVSSAWFTIPTTYYLIWSLSAAFAIREYSMVVPQILQQTRRYVTFALLAEYGAAFVGVGLLLYRPDVAALMAGIIIATFLVGFGNLLLTLRKFPYYYGIDRGIIHRFLAFSLPLIPVSLSQWGLQGLDNYFINYWHGAEPVGIYSVAYSLASLSLVVLAAVNFTYYPTAVIAKDHGLEFFSHFYGRWLNAISAGMGVILITLTVFSEYAVLVLSGPGYARAGMLIPIIVVGYWGQVLSAVQLATPVVMERKSWLTAVATLFALLVNVGLNFLLIRRFDLVGASWATALSYLAQVIIGTKLLSRYYPQFRHFPVTVGVLMIAGVGVAGAMLSLRVPQQELPTLIAMWFVGTSIFVLLAAAIGAVKREELRLLMGRVTTK